MALWLGDSGLPDVSAYLYGCFFWSGSATAVGFYFVELSLFAATPAFPSNGAV